VLALHRVKSATLIVYDFLIIDLIISPTMNITNPIRKISNPNISESKLNNLMNRGVSKKRIAPTTIRI
jgi:hypothetical protein